MNKGGPIQLKLWGPARLEYQGREIKLQRKGLAILYYLALEGATRREVLADLLWGHPAASQNLRVELHRLSQALAPLGYTPFKPGEDPLQLPPFITLDRTPGPGAPMEGLEELSVEFRAWLEGQRSQLMANSSGTVGRERLVQEVAAQLVLPAVIIVMGRPGSGRAAFAQALAKTLGMPFLEGPRGGGRALHYLRPPYNDVNIERILNDREGLWVIERSAYGEDPRLILELRSHYPAERTRYITLPPLSWAEARATMLTNLPFAQAARFYLASGGSPGHLRELLAVPQNGREVPLPQRVRAQVQLEARMLSMDGRLALERLSVHPGPYSQGLLDALEATPYLDELERRGWLTYNGQWQFSDDASRRILYMGLQPGRRQQYHRQAALQCALEEQRMAEAYHRLMAGDTADWGTFLDTLTGWMRYGLKAWLGIPEPLPLSPGQSKVARGNELALLEETRFGPGFEVDGRHVRWVRTPSQSGASGIIWAPHEEPSLLHLKGHAYVENPLGVGISGRAAPLVIEIQEPREARVIFLPGVQAGAMADNALILPLSEELDVWFRVPAGASIRLSSNAESALIDIEATSYRIAPPTQAALAPQVQVFEFFRNAVEAARKP
ncbi:MAG: transcriptional regulator [Meiothermus sp.]|uniref:transcriptional regulator n=1 Tax=Meiothermus sp. TaxID=1955249 RepID=UPI0025D9D1A2|nr:transcriptional regulator [Meiothermus sp.]MCS7057484.1 transcriptional regulator [Meiothermus sp.]MCX7739757.1 transcriptional regulator [Meiothermus sp.]MDW8480913.1 transcriptional regulator [Meiothermus sp.]